MTGVRRPQVTEDTLLYKLPYGVVKSLSLRLDIDRQWERLVTKIPKRLSDVGNRDPHCEMRYSHLQIRLFEEKSKRPDGSPTSAIINEWATQNPKVKHLLRVLQEAALYEAADYLAVDVMHQGKVPRFSPNTSEESRSLPFPAWDDKKLADDRSKISSTNFNSGQDKVVYDRQKDLSYDEAAKRKNLDSLQMPDSTYDCLMNKSENENQYRCLSPEAAARGVMYTRIPSYTSGEGRSLLVEGGNMLPPMDHPLPMEHEESMYQKAKPIEEYSYALPDGRQAKLREPCESSDNTKLIDTRSELYNMIGPQKEMKYKMLQDITNDFDRELLSQGGRVIGTGGFGEVFLGVFGNGHKVAVKKLKNVEEVDKQFQTELEALTKFRHKNIVCLYAYSVDGPGKCLVYEYMQNGSLEDRLVRKDGTRPLTVEERMVILLGTAEGIAFLNGEGIVHRDIKSANVLLDENLQPKVGDFATARTGPRSNATAPISTSVVIGTPAYLAPEATSFDVSTKLDSYSYGVIILEVLTALPPIDQQRVEKDLKSHVDDSDIFDILDMSAGDWRPEVVDGVIKISDMCLCLKKKQRCNVADILPELKALCSFT